MKQLIQNSKTGELKVMNVPDPQCNDNGVLVKTLHSVISTGTERLSTQTAKASLIGKAKLRPDLVEKVYNHYKKHGFINTYNLVKDRLGAPMPLGYSCSGYVIEVGCNVSGYKVGDLVACGGGGYALHSDINFVPQNLITKVHSGISSHSAAYTTLGSIAMQGVRQANISLGGTVVVIGLGLVGQLTGQILKASGCKVIGIDISDFALNFAPKNECWSIDHGFNANEDGLVEKILDATRGYGADSIIITASSPNNKPLLLAGDIIRDRGVLVIVGGVELNIPRSPFYDKEVEIKFSRSYGPGRYDKNYEEKGIDYPIGYVRWTENRNMQSFLDLVFASSINPKALSSKVFPIEKADEAFNLVLNPSENFMGIIIEYDKKIENNDSPNYYNESLNFNDKPNIESDIKVAFLGLGNFAQTYIMPYVKKRKNIKLVNVCNTRGMTANHMMKKYGFLECSTSSQNIFKSKNINTVFITSRHDSHSKYIINAIQNNKNIYVEKPIAINRNQLNEIQKNLANGFNSIFHVGYNRRFSSISSKIKDILKNRIRPLSIIYRINAGFLPNDHWLQDKKIGGGRIIGEICHFIDYILFITNSKVVNHKTMTIINNNSNFNKRDNLHINLSLEDGSVATIIYCIDGSNNLSKEYIEISGDKKSIVIDDFKKFTLYENGKKNSSTNRTSEKGYKNQINQFLDAIKFKNKQLIETDKIIHGMDVTLAIDEQLNI